MIDFDHNRLINSCKTQKIYLVFQNKKQFKLENTPPILNVKLNLRVDIDLKYQTYFTNLSIFPKLALLTIPQQ